MRKIISVISAMFVGMYFFAVSPAFGDTQAIPYQPDQSVTVVSESILAAGPAGVFWRIVPEICENGSFCLAFYRDEIVEPVCRLVPGGATPGLYLTGGARFNNTISVGNLMLFPGFSLPCDIFPVNAACGVSEPDVVEIRRQAGESTFIEQFQIECKAVEPAEALARGWIRQSGGETHPLVMIGVTSLKTGENVSRQLWIPGEAWWLYEETPYRRSWRLR